MVKQKLFNKQRFKIILCLGYSIELSKIQKQPPKIFCKKKVFSKISQISQENIFVAGLKSY